MSSCFMANWDVRDRNQKRSLGWWIAMPFTMTVIFVFSYVSDRVYQQSSSGQPQSLDFMHIQRQGRSTKKRIPNVVAHTDRHCRSICRISTGTSWATGCLCQLDGKKFILVNNHVIMDCDVAEMAIAEFDYIQDGPVKPLRVRLDPHFFYTSYCEFLDYTAIGYIGDDSSPRSHSDPLNYTLTEYHASHDLNTRRHYDIRTQASQISDQMSIVIYHHADAGPMVKTRGMTKKVTHSVYWGHDAITLSGSSGGPIIDRESDTLIGIHCGNNCDSEDIKLFTPISSIFTNLVHQIRVEKSRPRVYSRLLSLCDDTDDDSDDAGGTSEGELRPHFEWPDAIRPFIKNSHPEKRFHQHKEVLRFIRNYIKDSSPSIDPCSIKIRKFGLFLFHTTQVIETRHVTGLKEPEKDDLGVSTKYESMSWASTELDKMAQRAVRSGRYHYKDNYICLDGDANCGPEALCECIKAVSTIKEVNRKCLAVFPRIEALPPEVDINNETNYISCGEQVEGPRLTLQHFKDIREDYPEEIAAKAISETLIDIMPCTRHNVLIRRSSVKLLVVETYSFTYNSRLETIWQANGQAYVFNPTGSNLMI